MSLLDTASLICTPNGYKEGKLYSVIPSDGSGDLSVTRATTATRVNSAGLVELVPYNLLTYSEDFTLANGYNYQNSSQSSSTIISPFGTVAKGITSTTSANDFHRFYKSATIVGATYTTSIYANKGTSRYLAIGCYHNGSASLNNVVVFDLQNGVIASNPYGVTATIQDAGNGWYRVSHTYTYTGASGIDICIHNSGNSTYVASGFQTYDSPTAPTTLYVTGIQFVEGSVAKPYQKTETRLNIPRLDYSNGTCPSILLEPQRTNVLTYSSSFDNGAWVKATAGTGSLPVVTANSTISPSGIQDADTIVLNAGGGTTPSDQSQIYQLYNVTAGTTYTMSFYAKGAVGGEQIMIRQAGLGSYTKITLTNEWKRYTITETAPLTIAASVTFIIRRGLLEPINASATFYLWGAQLEAGSYATSYIPTTSASVTRNGDAVYRDSLSVFGTNQGTFFTDCEGPYFTNYEYLFDLSDNSSPSANRFAMYSSPTGLLLYTDQERAISASNTARKKIAIAWDASNTRVYINGSQVLSFSYSNPNPTSINLNSRFSENEFGNSRFYSVATWPTKLTSTQLAQLTTI